MLKFMATHEDDGEVLVVRINGERLFAVRGADTDCASYDKWDDPIAPRAASLLYAFEQGVSAMARWIAVELLKDPGPLPVGDERVYGVGLELLQHDSPWRLKLAHDLARDDCGGIYRDARQWNTVEACDIDMIPQRSVCASAEQALAVLIKHAAPWIAAALVAEANR